MATSSTPLTDDEASAIRAFAKSAGRRWKAALNLAWYRGGAYRAFAIEQRYEGVLQSLRNYRGPSWLASYRLPPEPDCCCQKQLCTYDLDVGCGGASPKDNASRHDDKAIWCTKCKAVVEYACLCADGNPAFPLVTRPTA